MWTFPSEIALRRTVLSAVSLLALATVAFFVLQNRLGIIGGEIAFSKALWLAEAILLWILLPAFIACDRRTPSALRSAFCTLLALMAIRAVVEPWMLYVSLNWSPLYGIAHDVACAAGVLGFASRARRATYLDPAVRLLLMHARVTALAFVPEIYYAYYMWSNFNTKGGQAVYFVPDDPRHAFALAVTNCVDALLLVYLALFLFRWLYDKTARAPAAA